MRSPGFRTLFAAWTLALVVLSIGAVAGAAYLQTSRAAREEALARAERGAARGLEALARGLTPAEFEEEAGVELVIRTRRDTEGAFGDPRVALWRRALEGEPLASRYDDELGAVVVRPLPGSPPEGVLEARVTAERARAAQRRFAARIAVATVFIACLAVAVALAVARRLTRPLDRLQAAAVAIGGGDLTTPVSAGGAGELAALGDTLETMRRRLREATSELERRRGELEAVVSAVAEGMLAVDRDRRVRFLSAPAAALLGVEPAAALGRFCGDLLHSVDERGERPCDDSCPILHARFRGSSRAVESIAPPGGARAVVVRASPPSEGLQVVILAEETPVEAARRARDAAVADLAHELQTPLAAQAASLELLRERAAAADPGALELVLTLEAGTLRLRRLIDNLLESVRIESGELALRRVEVHLDEVVEEAVALAGPLLARQGHRLEVELPHPMPPIAADPTRLAQVLVNLLSNASKVAPPGTAVRVGGRVGEREVEIWVEDDGPGFPPGLEPQAAGRFHRAGPDSRAPGSGLGLWISRSILERHGGALRVERADGRTRVAAALPRGEPA
jgi:signal transduction histidine kinase